MIVTIGNNCRNRIRTAAVRWPKTIPLVRRARVWDSATHTALACEEVFRDPPLDRAQPSRNILRSSRSSCPLAQELTPCASQLSRGKRQEICKMPMHIWLVNDPAVPELFYAHPGFLSIWTSWSKSRPPNRRVNTTLPLLYLPAMHATSAGCWQFYTIDRYTSYVCLPCTYVHLTEKYAFLLLGWLDMTHLITFVSPLSSSSLQKSEYCLAFNIVAVHHA